MRGRGLTRREVLIGGAAAGAAIKEQTGKSGLIFETRGVTPWRVFLTLYSQLGGPPIIEEGGSRIGMDDGIAVRALEWMAKPHALGVAGPDVDYQGSVAFFSNESAAFALNGEWEVTTYHAMDLPFGIAHSAHDLRRPANQADSHTFMIPRDPQRPRERLDATLSFVARLVNKGLDWAKGGHVPAYRPIFDSDDYRKLSPQSDYAAAVDHLSFDPLAWYSGSGSNLETNAGRTAERTRTRRTRDPRRGQRALVFTAPFFILFTLFLFWPVLSALWASLFDDSAVRVPRSAVDRVARAAGMGGSDVAQAGRRDDYRARELARLRDDARRLPSRARAGRHPALGTSTASSARP